MAEGIFQEDECEDGSTNREDDKVLSLDVKDLGRDLINHLLFSMRAQTLEEQEAHVESCAECIESLVLATASIILDELTDPTPREWKVEMTRITSEGEDSGLSKNFVARTSSDAKDMAQEYCKKMSTLTTKYFIERITEF